MARSTESIRPGLYPCPFSVVVDSREQAPWEFKRIGGRTFGVDGIVDVPLVRSGLPTGDYSIDGLPNFELAIERKGKGDFFHCMGADRSRFKNQVKRLSKYKHAVVIVEADWVSILKGHPRSQLSPSQVFRNVYSWKQQFPTVQWEFCFDRNFAERVAFEYMRRYWMERNDPETIRRRGKES